MKSTTTALLAALATVSATLTAAQSEQETLLTVTTQTGVMEYTLSDLEALDPVTIETTTIWTDGMQTFTGVPLVVLVEDLDVDSGAIFASAINDYTVEIPLSDAVEGGPIVAYLNNGEEMSVRDKGPLWVVYPYDSSPDYQSEVIYSRSIWQLDRLEVKE